MLDINKLGPLGCLVGQWYGNMGKDYFPTPDGDNSISSTYVESMTFTPIAPVQNGPQKLYGVQYTTVLTGTEYIQQQHQESGYYLWNPRTQTIIKAFSIPRGEVIMAKGGLAPWLANEPSLPKEFTDTHSGAKVKKLFNDSGFGNNSESDKIIYLSASENEPSYGILNTPFLDKSFNITEFGLILTLGTVTQQQKNPFDPSQTVSVSRLQLNYFECSALKYSKEGSLKYHIDVNQLWKQV